MASEHMEDSSYDILLVEDDEKLGAEIERTLRAEGFSLRWLRDGTSARWENPESFRLVVLDLMLPGTHGFDLLKHYRTTSDVPVIILTARKDTFDKVRGFELGGDDYMTKPFWPEELVARVLARLRRPTMKRGDAIAIGPVSVLAEARQVFVDDQPLELTRVEFDILHTLAKRPGMAMTRVHLVERALDEEREGTERTLDVHVSRIRKKMGAHSVHLETVWGIGYRLTAEPKVKKKKTHSTPNSNG